LISSHGYYLTQTFMDYSFGIQPYVVTETWYGSSNNVIAGPNRLFVDPNAPDPGHRFGVAAGVQLFKYNTYYLKWDTSIYANAGQGALIQAGKVWTFVVAVVPGTQTGATVLSAPPVSDARVPAFYSLSNACIGPTDGFPGLATIMPWNEGAYAIVAMPPFFTQHVFHLTVLNTTTANDLNIMNAVIYYPSTNQIVTWFSPTASEIAASYGSIAVATAVTNASAPLTASQITTLSAPVASGLGFASNYWQLRPFQPNASAIDPNTFAIAGQYFGGSRGFGYETAISYETSAQQQQLLNACGGFQLQGAVSTEPTAALLGTVSFTATAFTTYGTQTSSSSGAVGSVLNVCHASSAASEVVQLSAVFGSVPVVPYLGYTINVTQNGVSLRNYSATFASPKTDSSTVSDLSFSYSALAAFLSAPSAPPLNVTWTFLGPAQTRFPFSFQVYAGTCAPFERYYASVSGGAFTTPHLFSGYSSGGRILFDMYVQPNVSTYSVFIKALFTTGQPRPSAVTELLGNGAAGPVDITGTYGATGLSQSPVGGVGNGANVQVTSTWTVGSVASSVGISFVMTFIPTPAASMPNTLRKLVPVLSDGSVYGMGMGCWNDPGASLRYFGGMNVLSNGYIFPTLYANYSAQGFQFTSRSPLYNVTVSNTIYYLINGTIQNVLSSQVLTWDSTGTIGTFQAPVVGGSTYQTSTFWTTDLTNGFWRITPAVAAFVPNQQAQLVQTGVVYYFQYSLAFQCAMFFFPFSVNTPIGQAASQVGRPLFFQAVLWNQPSSSGSQTKGTPLTAVYPGQNSFSLNLCSLSAPLQASVQLLAAFPSGLLPYTVRESRQQAGNPSATSSASINVNPIYGSTIDGGFAD
jgi:hypothetical protein